MNSGDSHITSQLALKEYNERIHHHYSLYIYIFGYIYIYIYLCIFAIRWINNEHEKTLAAATKTQDEIIGLNASESSFTNCKKFKRWKVLEHRLTV